MLQPIGNHPPPHTPRNFAVKFFFDILVMLESCIGCERDICLEQLPRPLLVVGCAHSGKKPSMAIAQPAQAEMHASDQSSPKRCGVIAGPWTLLNMLSQFQSAA